MEYKTILFEVGETGVATITLNRPQAMNSFNQAMVDDFDHVWGRIREDDAIRSVVLQACEGRAFCTGVDVKNGLQHADNIWNRPDPGAKLGPKAHRVWKPVIIAVHGMACGGAFYWINEGDIVICSPEAQFFDPHVTYGMTSSLEPIGATYKMPLHEVLRMTLMGNDERISAETALRISLVTEVVERDKLHERAHEIAARIAEKPAMAIQGSVRAIWESLNLHRNAALERGMLYPLLGVEGKKEVDRATTKTPDWKLR